GGDRRAHAAGVPEGDDPRRLMPSRGRHQEPAGGVAEGEGAAALLRGGAAWVPGRPPPHAAWLPRAQPFGGLQAISHVEGPAESLRRGSRGRKGRDGPRSLTRLPAALG